MSNQILENVQSFLKMATDDSVAVSDKLIDEFGEMCKDAFRKQFTNKREKSFRARMSNIGKPLCQLQMEKSNAEPEGQPYNNKMRNTFGDLIEALAVTIIKASGIKVDSTQKSVSYNMDKSKIDGTYDIEIGNSIYDIKSASPYAFEHKFGDEGGFNSIVEDDSFGYLSQGYLYSESENKRFGGWIVINKSTGEWAVVDAPEDDGSERKRVLQQAEDIIKVVKRADFKKAKLKDDWETYKKDGEIIRTKNRLMPKLCSFCEYKKHCWQDARLESRITSKAKSPPQVWYTRYVQRSI